MTNEKESPYQWVRNRDGYRTLLRTKHPRLAIEVQDEADEKQIADALRKAAEFLLKGDRKSQMQPVQRSAYRKNGELYAMDMFAEGLEEKDYKFAGDICDEECGTDCGFFRIGMCPYVTKTTANGERIKVNEYMK